MREPAHPGGQTGDGRVLHCFQYIVEETLKQSWLVRDSACRGVCRGGLTHVGAAVLRGRVRVCNLGLSLAEQAFAQGLTLIGGAVAPTLLQLGNHELDEVLEGAG